MNVVHPPLRQRVAALLLSLASGPAMWLAVGQDARAADAEAPSPPAHAAPAAPARVGDATAGLLALQREGRAASTVPRPIAGEVATRSHQRYLKSFEHPIPERLGATIGGGSSAGSAGR